MDAQEQECRAKRVWATVLIIAIEDLAGNPCGCQTRKERARACTSARTWIMSNRRAVGSFNYCCEVLGFSPDDTRRRILRDPGAIIVPTGLGGAIKKYRQQQHITQQELAARLGTNASALSLVEMGRHHRISLDLLAAKIRELLKTEAPDLINAEI